MTDPADLLAAHPLPERDGGKDDHGTVVVIGGPPTCPGAVLLAGTAALRCGSGRVQLVVDPSASSALAVAVPEALVTGWAQHGEVPDRVVRLVASADAVVVGPGHRALEEQVVQALVAAATGPVVLDAGALAPCTSLAAGAVVVVAPNPAEAAELVGAGTEHDLAARLAAELGRPVAVRGPVTVVADGDRAWTFDRAPRGLGTPGSGDVFVGVLGALLAAGMAPVGALGWAVELHARAGARLAATTPSGYLAREIADQLPYALADLPERGGDVRGRR